MGLRGGGVGGPPGFGTLQNAKKKIRAWEMASMPLCFLCSNAYLSVDSEGHITFDI